MSVAAPMPVVLASGVKTYPTNGQWDPIPLYFLRRYYVNLERKIVNFAIRLHVIIEARIDTCCLVLWLLRRSSEIQRGQSSQARFGKPKTSRPTLYYFNVTSMFFNTTSCHNLHLQLSKSGQVHALQRIDLAFANQLALTVL